MTLSVSSSVPWLAAHCRPLGGDGDGDGDGEGLPFNVYPSSVRVEPANNAEVTSPGSRARCARRPFT